MNWKFLNAMALGLMWMDGYLGSPRALREHVEALRGEEPEAACAGCCPTACASEPGPQRLGQMFDA